MSVYSPTKEEVSAVRRSYLHPSRDIPLRIGDVCEADSITAFAFGRRSIDDSKIYETLEALKRFAGREYHSDDLTFLFEAMANRGFDPGPPNRKLAFAVLDADEKTGNNLKLELQWEVAFALYQQNSALFRKMQNRMVPLFPQVGDDGYRAYHVARDIKRSRDEESHQALSPLVIALLPMLSRTVMVCWRAGLSPIVAQESFFGNDYHRLSNWDLMSIQKQIHSEEAFLKREWMVRVHHVLTRAVRFSPPAA
ncbi:MAG: hypothetical protein NVSMB66_0130 [Candidatus Doudnabacteria bacterium]